MRWLRSKGKGSRSCKIFFFFFFSIVLITYFVPANHFLHKKRTFLRMSSSKVKTTPNYTVSYIVKPLVDMCKGVGITVLVKSAPNNFEQRQIIRDTWASVHNVSGNLIQTIFLLGTTGNRTTNLLLTKEAAEYNDILMGSFIDSYLNLTVKSSFGLQWIREYCRETSFVMLGDDDVHLKLRKIATYYLINSPNVEASLYCGVNLWKSSKVLRKGVYEIPFDFYPAPIYPPYCSGPCYMMPTDVAISISLALTLYPDALTHRIKVEDALLTGIIRQHVGYPIASMPTGFCEHLRTSKEMADKLISAWLTQ